MYGYLHDQTLRMMNTGHTGIEIAEESRLPSELEKAWHVRGYYGSVSHGVKAIYQRCTGWFDGNPAHLWQHPPEAQGARYVRALGGPDKAVESARMFADEGDLRFAAELASHVVFGAPDRQGAKDLLADVLTRLGYGAECATWRNFFLQGANELREGIPDTPIALAAGMASALSATQVFDSLAIRVSGPRAWDEKLSILWKITERDPSHGPFARRPHPLPEPQETTADGLLDEPDPKFPIVTP